MKRRLSPRMREILAEVPPCRLVCDVGCDHGYLGCALLEEDRCERVLFSDVSAESLAKAERLVRSLGLTGRAAFFVSDGLSHMTAPADAAVVAGMGGREIAAIVTRSPASAERFVLQPMKNAPELRTALSEAGFAIGSDRKIEDGGRFYDLLTVRFAGVPQLLTGPEIKYGRSNLEQPERAFLHWIARRKAVFRGVLERDGLSEADRSAALAELAELEVLEREA